MWVGTRVKQNQSAGSAPVCSLRTEVLVGSGVPHNAAELLESWIAAPSVIPAVYGSRRRMRSFGFVAVKGFFA
jgi:hypothetical protein